jgi:cysteinyl-tRNA synthetase
MAIRHQLMTAHYRHQLNFTLEGIDQSAQALARLWDFADRLAELTPGSEHNDQVTQAVQQATQDFEAALDDDLNIPGAQGCLFEVMKVANPALLEGALDAANVTEIQDFLALADSVFGYLAHEKASLDSEIEALIEERKAARAAKNFARSDEIRDELAARGIVLEDGPQGTRWRRAG